MNNNWKDDNKDDILSYALDEKSPQSFGIKNSGVFSSQNQLKSNDNKRSLSNFVPKSAIANMRKPVDENTLRLPLEDEITDKSKIRDSTNIYQSFSEKSLVLDNKSSNDEKISNDQIKVIKKKPQVFSDQFDKPANIVDKPANTKAPMQYTKSKRDSLHNLNNSSLTIVNVNNSANNIITTKPKINHKRKQEKKENITVDLIDSDSDIDEPIAVHNHNKTIKSNEEIRSNIISSVLPSIVHTVSNNNISSELFRQQSCKYIRCDKIYFGKYKYPPNDDCIRYIDLDTNSISFYYANNNLNTNKIDCKAPNEKISINLIEKILCSKYNPKEYDGYQVDDTKAFIVIHIDRSKYSKIQFNFIKVASNENYNPISSDETNSDGTKYTLIILSIECMLNFEKKIKSFERWKTLYTMNESINASDTRAYLAADLSHDSIKARINEKRYSFRSNNHNNNTITTRTKTNPNINLVLDNDDKDPILVYTVSDDSKDSITIYNYDISRLNPDIYLNDTLIDLANKYYISNYISTNPDMSNKIYCFSCLFYKKLSESRNLDDSYQLVSRWTKNVDIFSMEYIFIPINYGIHWSLVCILRCDLIYCYNGLKKELEPLVNSDEESSSQDSGISQYPCILFMDSLKLHDKRKISNQILGYLSREWVNKKSFTSPDSQDINFKDIKVCQCQVPIQPNGYDCGVYVIVFVQWVLKMSPKTSKKQIDNNFKSYFNKDTFPDINNINNQRNELKEIILSLSKKWLVSYNENKDKEKQDKLLKKQKLDDSTPESNDDMDILINESLNNNPNEEARTILSRNIENIIIANEFVTANANIYQDSQNDNDSDFSKFKYNAEIDHELSNATTITITTESLNKVSNRPIKIDINDIESTATTITDDITDNPVSLQYYNTKSTNTHIRFDDNSMEDINLMDHDNKYLCK